MKTKEILELDYREEENKKIIQRVLRKIPPLNECSKSKQVPLKMIEDKVKELVVEYEIEPNYIGIGYTNEINPIYCVVLKSLTENKYLGNVYGMCLYEAFAKLLIKIFSEIKTGKVKERSEEVK